MKNKKVSKKTFFIILGVLLIGVLTVFGTYAYFAWSSTGVDKDATVSVTSVNGLGQCDKITDNQKILWPVSSRNNGRIVTVNAKQTLSEYAYIVWTLTIDSINTIDTETDGLKHRTFKYELVNTTTGVSYGSGNFENLDVGDTITFSNNEENLAYDTNYMFTLYLWIDGTIGSNPMDMTNQTYQFSLVCDITGEPADKTNERIDIPFFETINPITDYEYEIGTGVTEGYVILKKYIGTSPDVVIPDTYTIDGVTYNTALYAHSEPMGEFHDTSTFESNTVIKNVVLPNNYKMYYYSQYYSGTGIVDTRMDYLFSGCTSLEYISEIPSTITNMYYTFSGCNSLADIPELPVGLITMQGALMDTAIVNAPVIPSGVTNMGAAFYGCTSLVSAPAIPSGVTNMSGTFAGCTSLVSAPAIPSGVTNLSRTFDNCSSLTTAPEIPSTVTSMSSTFMNCANLTGTIRINASGVSNYWFNSNNNGYHPFYGTVNPITVEVPADSTTYTRMQNLKPDNVTIVTFTPE